MDSKTILADASARMQKSVDFLEDTLLNIRAGKASTNVLNGVFVDYYGSQTPVSGVASYCSILAVGLTNVGWIMGSPRAAATLATNCKLGGTAYGDYDDEDEFYKKIPIDKDNFYNYIYGGTTDWTGVDNYDGCSTLASKPTIQ